MLGALKKAALGGLYEVRAGDTLVVWRLDRLGRSLPDLVKIIGELELGGITFERLSEKIDTGQAQAERQADPGNQGTAR